MIFYFFIMSLFSSKIINENFLMQFSLANSNEIFFINNFIAFLKKKKLLVVYISELCKDIKNTIFHIIRFYTGVHE